MDTELLEVLDQLLRQNREALTFIEALDLWRKTCDKHFENNCKGCPLLPCHWMICEVCKHQPITYCPYYWKCGGET